MVRCNWLLGNGDVSGWQGKRNRPCWKTSTEWQRRETVANHAAGIAPSAPTRSLGINQCGSSEKRENNRIHRGPRDRNGSLGANVVGERHALPRSCTTFSGGRAFTDDLPLFSGLGEVRAGRRFSRRAPSPTRYPVIEWNNATPRFVLSRRRMEIQPCRQQSQSRKLSPDSRR